ncbi:MAG TPA: cyclic pyranopterin monophosphate synthase MoaC [Rhodothermales bacterium]|nr:cyclic pyranopterin monophosphate synthase MoaC [Rhodothermales bacterium]
MSEVESHARGVRLIDVSERPVEVRTAVASGRVRVGEGPFRQIQAGVHPKGDVLTVAQVAGILGAKQASRLLPLCQDVVLRGVEVEMELDETDFAVTIRAYVKAHGATGVAMEALTAVSIAALTIFDMCRAAARDAEITEVRLVAKTGGQSGDYLRRG